MKQFAVLFCSLFLLLGSLWAKGGDRRTETSRLEKAGDILNEIMSAPDQGIPQEIVAHAKCVAVVPSMLKAGFGLGGQWGQGVVTCRTAAGWSGPAFYRVAGGSFGFQAGGEAVDLVMLIMNDRGFKDLLASKFKIGADASAAAGPIGRHAAGDTDITLRAEILSYSRTRGVFVGLTLNGNMVQQNAGDTRDFYGRNVAFRDILTGKVKPTSGAEPFLDSVHKNFEMAKTTEAK
jgi:lipid-binding SYLF domain-containing protein